MSDWGAEATWQCSPSTSATAVVGPHTSTINRGPINARWNSECCGEPGMIVSNRHKWSLPQLSRLQSRHGGRVESWNGRKINDPVGHTTKQWWHDALTRFSQPIETRLKLKAQSQFLRQVLTPNSQIHVNGKRRAVKEREHHKTYQRSRKTN